MWLGKQLGLAEEVVVCYEAGCFGYGPARRMQKMGVKVYVIAPQNWDEQGKGPGQRQARRTGDLPTVERIPGRA